jgi:hypothetical protein
MIKDQLYLLKHDFLDDGKTYYCPGCAELIGLMEIYPVLKKHIEIHFTDFPRPRPALLNLLGEANQSCPVLVLVNEPKDAPASLAIQKSHGHAFVANAREIGEYFAYAYGIAIPH